MAWNITPATAATLGSAALNDRKFVDQFWFSIAERMQATGADSPFPQVHAYDAFTITAIADNGDGTFTLTDASKDWTFAGGARKKWTEGIVGTDWPDWARPPFDVVIDADRTGAGRSEPDPRAVIQAPIASQPSATQVVCTFDLARAIREGGIASVASLVGRRGWVIRTGGDNYTRGFVRWPNARHYAYGRVHGVAVDTTAVTTTLTSDRALQHADVLVGKEVLYLDSGNRLRRHAITAVDAVANSLTFAGTSNPPVVEITPPLREFYVVDAGGYWQWDREGGPVQAAHAGLTTNYYAHSTTDDDETVAVGMPRLTYPVRYAQTLDACPIDPEMVVLRNDPDTDGVDVDYYVPYDNACGAGDYFVQPNWWQCWRALWSAAFQLAPHFVKPIDYDGAADISDFTAATWLYYAGINIHAGTCGTHSGTTMPCALGVPHTPVTLWWTIVNAAGKPIASGYEQAYDGATINGDFAALHDGKTVYASTGPTRICARAFATMRDVVYFVPDTDGDPPAAQTPSETYPGTWTTLAASTHYLTSDHDGYVGQSALARHAFANGHFARYVGHRLHDPGFPVRLPADTESPLAAWHNNAYVGRRQPTVESRIASAMSGTATGGSATRIEVAGVDFDALDFPDATNGLAHNFTAASGSTTGCTVPGVSGSTLWASGRFPGFAGPFVGFCVEFLMSGSTFADPAAVIEKRPIATGTTGGVIAWAEATSVSTHGLTARIIEPRVLNPWNGLTVTLTNPDGTTGTATITGSHGDTLFITDPDLVVGEGTSYGIARPRIGDVFKRVSGAWVTTSGMGADGRYGGSTFRDDAAANLEDLYVEYGLPLPTDVTFATVTGPQQLYDAINVLTDLRGGPTAWRGHATDGDGVPNHNISDFPQGSRGSVHTFGSHLDSYVESEFIDPSYADGLPGTDVGDGAPFSRTEHAVDEEFWDAEMEKRIGFLELSALSLPPSFPVGYTTRAYVFPAITAGDPDPGNTDGAPDVDGLRVRSSLAYDTSCGLTFRVWNYVGGGPGRIPVGGSLAAPADWGQVVDEAQIFSVDHDTATIRSWGVYTGWFPKSSVQVYSLDFKFR